MRIDGFGAGWDGGRHPLADLASEDARTAAYWAWSEGLDPGPGLALSPRVGEAPDGRTWHLIEDGPQADSEARIMSHSVGHSYDRYSTMGEIMSLRRDGMPEATILVGDRTVLHARRARNEPLLPADLDAVRDLADRRGWRVLDPALL